MEIKIASALLVLTIVAGCSTPNGQSHSGRSNFEARVAASQSVIHSGDSRSEIRAKLRSRGLQY